MPTDPNVRTSTAPGVRAAIARHASTRATEPAIVDGDTLLTYGELYGGATAYAEELKRSGIGRGEAVGLCARRGGQTVVAMLGLLLADAAFVPLDPSDPPERLRVIAKGADIRAVVSPERWQPEFEAAGLYCLPPASTSLRRADVLGVPEPEAGHPGDLAYVIHTSGSTGRPKGVGITGRALDHFCAAIAAGYGLAPGDRVLQFSSISFDGSIEEIFPPLYAGATVVVRDEEMISSPQRFLERSADLGLSILHVPTAYWHELVDGMVQDGLRLPAQVRVVSVGGEQMRHDRLADWRRLDLDARVRLVNVYGPTETTVIATWDDLAGPLAVPAVEGEPPAIGRPLPGVRVSVVGADGRPVPAGDEGELLIGGPTVGLGYVNLPELTAQRFSTDADGVRHYRTGDRVRQLPDGRLVHLGRMDRQIKVRGFRVEPVEVEQALIAHNRIRDAVVRYDDNRAALVGYLLLDGGVADPLDLAELRRLLGERLPEYAVPSLLVPVSAFPLNARGKVDADALATLSMTADSLSGAGPGLPEGVSDVQRGLAALIADVLQLDSVELDDSIFTLGAHSLTSIRIITRIAREFGVRLTLADLYANPTVKGLSALLADTAPGTRVPADATPDSSPYGAPQPAEEGESLPLTAFQRDAWLAEELQPGTPMHTLGLRYRVTGVTDPDEITSALRRLTARHEALSAVFRQGDDHVDDGPLMVFGGATPYTEVDVHDLTSLAPADRATRRRELALDRGRTVLDPATGPLLSATLLRLGADTWELVVAVHHLVFDGWSASVLAQDLAVLLGGGEPAPAGGFARHLRQDRRDALTGSRAALLEHWTTRLAGVDTDVELPADRPRPAVRSFAGAKIEHELDPALLARVEQAARQAGTTTHTFMLAALQILMSRMTGHTDITVLAPVARRDDPGSERSVGAFINVLPLRTDLSGDPDFRTVLRRATETVVDALSHQDQSLAELVRALPVRHRADRGPLTQVMLIVVNTPSAAAAHGRATVTHLGDTFPGTTKLDLTVTLDFPVAGPVLGIEYATELFDDVTVRRLLRHLLVLLEGALDRPGTPIGRLPLLSPGQRREILSSGALANTRVEPGGGGVHLLFEEHVRRTPDAPAVSHEGEQWSYARLDDEAHRLAEALRANGVRPGDRVGICLPRGPLMYAAVLAAWKAGTAYVPLDPQYPNERLRYMLTDSGARALLTDGQTECAPPDGVPVVLCAGETGGTGHARPSAEPAVIQVAADDPAYVLYTSGTTGLPKGVAVSHGNLRHAVGMWQEAYALEAGWSHLQAANSSFDVFAGEALRALCTGGRLVVCPHETLLDPRALHALLRDEGVAVAELVPAVLRGLLDLAGTRLTSLRVLAGGADKWYVHEYRRALALVGADGRVVNSYGVTEATIDNAYFEGDVDRLPAQAPLPIGRPYPGNRLYVLDAHGEPLPFGVPGELWIGGPGVALGYHERPELTASRFRPDPFSDAPGARMYRTGDGARLRADGLVDFLGRLDDQVKLNGHRIELDEVEAALAALPGVRSAAAAVRHDGRGLPRLVGYVVPADAGAPPAAAELRRGLQDFLPHYSIPAQTVVVPALPLSPNGKVDRKALPDPPEHTGNDASAEPETDTQRRLAALWNEILGQNPTGPDDGFFELGGDSFAALRLVRAIEQRYGVRVALMDLYRNPTVARLAEHVDALAGGGIPARSSRSAPSALLHRLTPDRTVPSAGTLVCIPFSGGHAVSFEPLASALPGDWTAYALQSPGRDWSKPDEEALPFDELIQRCLSELGDLPGPMYLYGHCHGSAITLELARRAEAAGLPLAGVAIGAMFPMARLPGRFFDWAYRHFPVDRLVSDRAILEEIRALGGGLSDLVDAEEQAFAMRAVRHDERGSEDYYARTLSQERDRVLRAPLLSVVGAKDRVTELYTERYHEWEHYADDVELEVIPKGGHGFLKHQAGPLADILVRWADRKAREDQQTEPGGAVPPVVSRRQPQPGLGRFAVVAAGQFVSSVGSALSQLVMSLWVYQQTGQITAFSMVMAVSLLPGILAGPVAGAVADRYDRRRVMLLSDLAAGLSTLAMIGLIAADRLSMPYVYALCGLTSLATAFQRPAYLAAVAQLVPKPFLGHANGITQLGTGAGALFAPMLGAGLLSLLPLPSILLIDVATFLVAVVTLMLVRFPDRLFRRREEPVGTQIVNGWRYVAKRPGLLAVLKFFIVDHLLYSAGFALIIPLVLMEHGVATLGVVLTAGGLGSLLGALTMGIWGGTRRRANGMILFMGANNLGLLVIGVVGEPWLVAAAMFGMAFTESLIDGHWIALVQKKVGLELQGRVLAIFITIVTVVMPLSYLVVGPLADLVFRPMLRPDGPLADTAGAVLGTGPGRGLALVIVVSGLLLTGWTVRAWFNRRLRLLEDVLPDAIPDAEIEDRDTEQRRADEKLAAATPTPSASSTEQDWLDTWQHVYDTSYAGSWDAMGEDFTGWDSSYDGDPIPVAQMREWRAATVDRILELRPRRVLEIGVGSGVFLAKIAPHCEKYVGTDLSPVAVATLSAQLAAHPALRDRVELRAQPAHVTDGLPAACFDTVVINSVVQYFPSGDYLDRVLSEATRLLAPGGRIFVGDVRNLRLQRCLSSAVQVERSPAGTEPAVLRAAVDQAIETENELLVDPAFFTGFAARSADVVAVDLRTKRGRSHNELTRYRYDVVLAKAPARVVSLAGAATLAWGIDVVSLTDLAGRLNEGTVPLRITGVPNGRILADLPALRAASGTAPAMSDTAVPDPEEFHDLGTRLGHWTATTWSATDDERLEVLFVPGGQVAGTAFTDLYLCGNPSSRPHTNTPAAGAGLG